MPSQSEAEAEGGGRSTGSLFDAVVIGTGFGGAVAACRLTQAGKNVCVLERGRRYDRGDFPRPATRPDHLPHTARWAWALDHGLWDVKDLQGTLAIQAAGYGGGSLAYANVHLRAPEAAFARPTRHGPDADGWPAAYSREELDPYYDVVAAVLRVRPIPSTFIPTALVAAPLPKVEAMRGAARALGREPWFFLPPLAIDFDACVMCGECIAGCQFHAKNTLDLNYLAVAERLGADVRTLAEVLDIRRDDGADAYTVTYHDHVTGDDKATVRARSVFLCAGSVNSTHILLRTKGRVGMAEASKPNVGRRFFVNGDAIAMLYDTATPPAPTPTRGPTIATSLLYNNGALDLTGTRGDWFMIQDGGYPRWLEPVLGLLRSDFWLQRNRIAAARGGRTGNADAAARDAAAMADLVEKTTRALLGVLDARRAHHDPSQARVLASRFGLSPKDGARSLARGLGIDDVLPPQVRQIVGRAREHAHSLETEEVDALSQKSIEELAYRLLTIGVHDPFPDGPLRPVDPEFVKGFQEVFVEPHRLIATREALRQYFLKIPRGVEEPFTAAILWARVVSLAKQLFLGQRPDDYAFLMLVMGIDAAPGQLYLDEEQRLLAYWDLAANARLATMQERLMHDVADALKGEMRLNPDATVRQRPVTVHNLGGCAMSDRPEDGVTDPDGKVWGTRALYVLDGAAMPGSLGANPSATIAAIAERNVRKALADKASPIHAPAPVPLDPPLPGGPSLAEIRQRYGQTPAVLDPIAQITSPSPEPAAQAVGLTFTEVMQGFYVADGSGNLAIRADLVATIDDLSAFLVNPRRPVGVEGTVRLVPAPGRPEVEYAAKGTLELLKRVEAATALRALFDEGIMRLDRLARLRAAARSTSAVDPAQKDAEDAMESLLRRLEKATHRYEMDYVLELTPRAGAPRLDRLVGVKRIYGGPGLAPWTETTTLHVTLHAGQQAVGTGEMHVHIADLLRTQLPSFRITGAGDDHVRIAWAYARFFQFFLGTLRQVYLPQLGMIDPFADRSR
jgi:choline dehydrogenase-like flavoprotein